MGNVVATVLAKELRDGLRDSRAILALFLVPFFFIAMLCALVAFLVITGQKSEQFELPMQGASRAGDLVNWLQEEGIQPRRIQDSALDRVESGEEDFALVVPERFSEQIGDFQSAQLELVFDHSRSDLNGRINRVRAAIQEWNSRLGSLRLIARGVAPRVASPVSVEEVDVGSLQKLSARLFAVIPVMLVMTVFSAAVGLAVDMMAGERERRSLEPLLLTPVSRGALLVGKWLAAALCTLAVFLLSAVAIYLIVPLLPLEALGLRYQVSLATLGRAVLVAVPLIAMATALQLLLSIFARSFKEAQNYVALLILLPAGTAYYVLFSQIETWQYWLPVVGPVALMEGVFSGDAMGVVPYLASAAVSLSIAAAAAWLTTVQFQRESIIYG